MDDLEIAMAQFELREVGGDGRLPKVVVDGGGGNGNEWMLMLENNREGVDVGGETLRCQCGEILSARNAALVILNVKRPNLLFAKLHSARLPSHTLPTFIKFPIHYRPSLHGFLNFYDGGLRGLSSVKSGGGGIRSRWRLTATATVTATSGTA
jgi:hypothetical protein